ncbi:MAG TPA: peptide chain release factor N(5)-glutamine methyltransferase [Planctomycetaceae bacterium]|nr:peptide chain release factor N(5)-glutamine methyltransferase [Planctomycetaceae bacterium]
MSQTETWTVGRLLSWTNDYFAKRGADSPRLDAEILLAEALGCRRIDLYARFDDVPDDTRRARFREMVCRRAEHAPVAYLVGHREFYSLSFRVTPDVLIPRPETELLVVAALDRLKARGNGEEPASVCDVGTGSGAIAVTLAKHLPSARLTAVDLSAAALAVARENARSHGVADRIEFVESDLFAALPPEARFDLIVSNPPYVSESEWADLSPEVRDHEPRIALVAGPRGTEIIERLLAEAAARLKPGGYLIVEISPMIHEAVCSLVESSGTFASPETIKDLARLPRIVCARLR